MSTNKTENYQLHAWELEDDFLLSEINQNFAAVDGALPANKKLKIVTGTYVGDDVRNRPIELGFRANIVFVAPATTSNNTLFTLLTDGTRHDDGTITDTGFTVAAKLNVDPSHTNIGAASYNPFRYLAIQWQTED